MSYIPLIKEFNQYKNTSRKIVVLIKLFKVVLQLGFINNYISIN